MGDVRPNTGDRVAFKHDDEEFVGVVERAGMNGWVFVRVQTDEGSRVHAVRESRVRLSH